MTDSDLFDIADSHQGYFTARQAIACGIHRANFHHRIASGEWTRERRGIYRLSRYPLTERPELAMWTLWSCDLKGQPQGVWSHETALDIHDLSDVMPNRMHMTVPKGFRRRSPIPKILRLHFENLHPDQMQRGHGYSVTTPLKTLEDIIACRRVAGEFVAQALEQALERGLVTRKELTQGPSSAALDELRRYLP